MKNKTPVMPLIIAETGKLEFIFIIIATMLCLSLSTLASATHLSSPEEDEAGASEYFNSAWWYGYDDCRATCSEYIESAETESGERRKKRQVSQENPESSEEVIEEEVIEEEVSVPNSEAYQYWNGYAQGYEYCTQQCNQFLPDEETETETEKRRKK